MSLKNFKAQGFAIEGMEELVQNLSDVMPREAKNLARSTVRGVAAKVRDGMRQRAPVDTGTLKKAIVVVSGKGTPTQVYSDVIITRGGGQKRDAWHWPYQEFGTQHHSAQPFIVPTVEEMSPKLSAIVREEWGKRLEKLLDKKVKSR